MVTVLSVLRKPATSNFRVEEEAVSSKMLVTIYQNKCCHSPEDSNLHTHHHENFKSHTLFVKLMSLSCSWKSVTKTATPTNLTNLYKQ
jgi:hypothetical protein